MSLCVQGKFVKLHAGVVERHYHTEISGSMMVLAECRSVLYQSSVMIREAFVQMSLGGLDVAQGVKKPSGTRTRVQFVNSRA